MSGGGREAHEGRDIDTFAADSCGTVETNRTLQSKYSPIKNEFFLKVWFSLTPAINSFIHSLNHLLIQ